MLEWRISIPVKTNQKLECFPSFAWCRISFFRMIQTFGVGEKSELHAGLCLLSFFLFYRLLISCTSETSWHPNSFSMWLPGQYSLCRKRGQAWPSSTCSLLSLHLSNNASLLPVSNIIILSIYGRTESPNRDNVLIIIIFGVPRCIVYSQWDVSTNISWFLEDSNWWWLVLIRNWFMCFSRWRSFPGCCGWMGAEALCRGHAQGEENQKHRPSAIVIELIFILVPRSSSYTTFYFVPLTKTIIVVGDFMILDCDPPWRYPQSPFEVNHRGTTSI